MKQLLLLCSLILMLLLSGCWSKREITDIGIILGMAIDRAEEGYEITVEAMKPGSLNPQLTTQSSPAILFSAKSRTICEGFRKLAYVMPRVPYVAHVSEVLIHEDVAKEGLAELMGCLMRDDELRYSTLLFIVKDVKAQNVLGIMTIMETVAANKILKITRLASKINSAVYDVNLTEFVNAMVADGQEAYVPGFTVVHGEENPDEGKKFDNIQTTDPKVFIKLIPYAVFKGDRLIGWLDEDHAKRLNLLLDKVDNTMIATPCDKDRYIVIETLREKTRYSIRFKDGQPQITVFVKMRARLCEMNCPLQLTDKKKIDQLEQTFEATIKRDLEETIQYMKNELQSDLVGFGEMIRKKDPYYWKQIKDEWDERFLTLPVEVKVDVKITDYGSIVNPLVNEMNER